MSDVCAVNPTFIKNSVQSQRNALRRPGQPVVDSVGMRNVLAYAASEDSGLPRQAQARLGAKSPAWGPNFSGDPTRLGPFFRADPDWALFFWVPHRAKIARLVPFFRGSNFGHSPTRAFACTSHRHVRLNVQMTATVMTMF